MNTAIVNPWTDGDFARQDADGVTIWDFTSALSVLVQMRRGGTDIGDAAAAFGTTADVVMAAVLDSECMFFTDVSLTTSSTIHLIEGA